MVYAQDIAQSDTNERLRACDALQGMTEKLDCFNAVVEGLDENSQGQSVESPPAGSSTGAAAASAAVATVTATAPEPAPATPDTADAAPKGAQTAAETATTSVAATAAVITAAPSADPDPPPAIVSTAPIVTSTATAEEQFGLEDVKAEAAPKAEETKQEELESIRATIVSAWATQDGRFAARLDNGQVWRETERTRRMRVPKEGSSVVISKGRLGGYKMKIGNDNRISAVRRTE